VWGLDIPPHQAWWVNQALSSHLSKRDPSEVKSGRTNLDREDSAFEPVFIEKEQKLLPVNGLSLATGVVGNRARGRNTRGRKARGKGRRRGGVPMLPPSRDRISVVSTVRRYSITNSATAVAVTRGSLASILGGTVTVANTTVTLWASSYKLRKIVVWPAAGSTVSIDATTTGTAEQALQRESLPGADMPTGVTMDRPVVFTPNAKSYLGLWQSTGVNASDQLFLVSGSSGAIIDVHIAYTLASGLQAAVTQGTTTTVALGAIVYMPMDGTNKITPIALNSALH